MPNLTHHGRRLLAAVLVLGALAFASADAAQTDGGRLPSSLESDACGPRLAKPDGGTWECSFVDEFDGGALDAGKWITQNTATSGFRSGLTCFRGASNVTVHDGTLLLEARDEGVPLNCDNRYGAFRTRYTGGVVSTRGHFSQTYGRFEARAKYPTNRTPGVHGAFWMFPLNPTYGPWPASGEIDIAEWWSNDQTLVLPSLHFNGRDPQVDSGWQCRVPDVSIFHTYAAEWSPTEIRFSIDDTTCFARTWTPVPPQVAPQPFDQPFSMILLMGVGTPSGTNIVTSTTALPATLTVDYAKAWR
jgi:beta-glucanase (GH16 family)